MLERVGCTIGSTSCGEPKMSLIKADVEGCCVAGTKKVYIYFVTKINFFDQVQKEQINLTKEDRRLLNLVEVE